MPRNKVPGTYTITIVPYELDSPYQPTRLEDIPPEEWAVRRERTLRAAMALGGFFPGEPPKKNRKDAAAVAQA